MRKHKNIQLGMFTPDEMNGGVERRDIFMEEFVAAYLKYMQNLSVLDDDTCRDILNECKAICGKAVDGKYRMKTLACSLNSIHYSALKDLIEMRLYASFADEYSHHEEGIYHTHVRFPSAFVEARDTFRKLYSDKYQGKDKWITNMSLEEFKDLRYFV